MKKSAVDAIDCKVASLIHQLSALQKKRELVDAALKGSPPDRSIRWVGAYPLGTETKVNLLADGMIVFFDEHGRWPTFDELLEFLGDGGAYLADDRLVSQLQIYLRQTLVPSLVNGVFELVGGHELKHENIMRTDIRIKPAARIEEMIRNGEPYNERREQRLRRRKA